MGIPRHTDAEGALPLEEGDNGDDAGDGQEAGSEGSGPGDVQVEDPGAAAPPAGPDGEAGGDDDAGDGDGPGADDEGGAAAPDQPPPAQVCGQVEGGHVARDGRLCGREPGHRGKPAYPPKLADGVPQPRPHEMWWVVSRYDFGGLWYFEGCPMSWPKPRFSSTANAVRAVLPAEMCNEGITDHGILRRLEPAPPVMLARLADCETHAARLEAEAHNGRALQAYLEAHPPEPILISRTDWAALAPPE